MAVSSKYTQDLSIQIVFFTVSCKWFLCFYFWAVIWSYTVDLFAALHELASATARTLLKLASSVRALLKPYGDTLKEARSKFKITWRILKHTSPYSPASNRCNLCLWEKFFIICKPERTTLNKRNELVTSCRHANKFLLKNFKPAAATR